MICVICAKEFQNESDCSEHMSCHNIDKQFNCEECEYTASTELEQEWHMETEHSQESGPIDNINCLTCTFSTSSEDDLEEHKVRVHSFPCSYCEEVFATEGSQKNHQKGCTSDKDDKIPQRTSTPSAQIDACELCGQIFDDENSQRMHLCGLHEDVPAENCDQCEFQCSTVRDMVKHLLDAHKTSNIRFQCNFCECQAAEKNLLDSHMIEYHEMLVVLNRLAQNQRYAGESFDKFKEEVTNTLQKVVDANETGTLHTEAVTPK